MFFLLAIEYNCLLTERSVSLSLSSEGATIPITNSSERLYHGDCNDTISIAITEFITHIVVNNIIWRNFIGILILGELLLSTPSLAQGKTKSYSIIFFITFFDLTKKRNYY